MIYYLLSPLTWGLLLALLLLASWPRLRARWRVAGMVLGGLVLLSCTPLGANQLIRLVESGVAKTESCASSDATPIVLLSGGLEGAPRTASDYAELTLDSWVRLRGAVDLWQGGGGELVIAGGGPFAVKESDVLAGLARDWDVAPADIRVERTSNTTWESAMALRGTLPADIRLVSSAVHLPRAVTAFRAAGFDPCVHSSDSAYLPPESLGALVPQSSAIFKSETAVYELVGGWAYRFRAWRNGRASSSGAGSSRS
ncbi:ElyC/SanA/YdcF family protein [Lysobacter sp. F6437]|uniref:ElyC/SanA/YdcF family protein n=1 Tax=Lysobacter sp. F6437 TaxID=3459296 RepID=UPI00403DDCF9